MMLKHRLFGLRLATGLWSKVINPSFTGNLITDFAANTEDPDEMLHNAAFHQGLHCLLRKKHNYRD